MLKKLNHSKIKLITMLFSLLLASFILTLIICVVTHTTPHALITSVLSEEIQFAIKLSLTTAVVSTILCIAISIPSAYALARYNFFGKSVVNTILDAPLALPPLVAGVGLLILFGTTSFGRGLAGAGLVFVFTP
jgi:molybdate transport system permease protein